MWINYECSVHSTASRDVLPDWSTGWRRSSQSGVDTGTHGRYISSLQSPGIIHDCLSYRFCAVETHIYSQNLFTIWESICDTVVHHIFLLK